jgi:hypothetical protein
VLAGFNPLWLDFNFVVGGFALAIRPDWAHAFCMTALPESKREQFERHAAECLDLVKSCSDPEKHATFIAMAAAWLKLAANETPPSSLSSFSRTSFL